MFVIFFSSECQPVIKHFKQSPAILSKEKINKSNELLKKEKNQ